MKIHLPADVNAETVASLPGIGVARPVFCGSHCRNAYIDILETSVEAEGLTLKLARNGIYHILPEALFHPVDRFEGIDAHMYKERVDEEIEAQKREESEALDYFRLFDTFIFALESLIADLKSKIGDTRVLSEIIADRGVGNFINTDNRFVLRMREYLPYCSRLRGNRDILSLILRRVLCDEGLTVRFKGKTVENIDSDSRYMHTLMEDGILDDTYAGNVYDEEILSCEIPYWSEEDSGESFLGFVAEMKEFETFFNYYFIGLETEVTFDITTDSVGIVLGGEPVCYLGYNSNLK